jgi:glutaredoxin
MRRGLTIALLASACSKEAAAPPTPTAPANVEIAVGEPQLRFTYLGKDGRFLLAPKAADVPAEARGAVMVVDLSQREASDVVPVVDLRAAPVNGRTVARLVDRAAFERMARGLQEAQRPPVTMYATAWCGVCRQARGFLARHGVKYVERDIEKEPAAGREMREKAAKAGIEAPGVPVFDIGGRILAGFNEAKLRELLRL